MRHSRARLRRSAQGVPPALLMCLLSRPPGPPHCCRPASSMPGASQQPSPARLLATCAPAGQGGWRGSAERRRGPSAERGAAVRLGPAPVCPGAHPGRWAAATAVRAQPCHRAAVAGFCVTRKGPAHFSRDEGIPHPSCWPAQAARWEAPCCRRWWGPGPWLDWPPHWGWPLPRCAAALRGGLWCKYGCYRRLCFQSSAVLAAAGRPFTCATSGVWLLCVRRRPARRGARRARPAPTRQTEGWRSPRRSHQLQQCRRPACCLHRH